MQFVQPHMIREDHVNSIGPLFSLIFLVIVVVGIILVVRMVLDHERKARTGTTSEPLDIARERYAKGEITKEELAEMKSELASK